jgi:hypothetical protein
VHIELPKGERRWYWRLVAHNGNIVATIHNYYSRFNARRAAQRLAYEAMSSTWCARCRRPRLWRATWSCGSGVRGGLSALLSLIAPDVLGPDLPGAADEFDAFVPRQRVVDPVEHRGPAERENHVQHQADERGDQPGGLANVRTVHVPTQHGAHVADEHDDHAGQSPGCHVTPEGLIPHPLAGPLPRLAIRRVRRHGPSVAFRHTSAWHHPGCRDRAGRGAGQGPCDGYLQRVRGNLTTEVRNELDHLRHLRTLSPSICAWSGDTVATALHKRIGQIQYSDHRGILYAILHPPTTSPTVFPGPPFALSLQG